MSRRLKNSSSVAIYSLMEERPSTKKPMQSTLLNLGTVSFIVAWLAVACDALAYLISHGPS